MSAAAPAPAAPLRGELALGFALAGRATFTLRSVKTGRSYTYRIEAPRDGADVRFAKRLAAGGSWEYLGTIPSNARHKLVATRKSAQGPGDEPFDALAWFLGGGWRTEAVELWHEGRCGKCGRPLTDPTSIETGLGPICRARD